MWIRFATAGLGVFANGIFRYLFRHNLNLRDFVTLGILELNLYKSILARYPVSCRLVQITQQQLCFTWICYIADSCYDKTDADFLLFLRCDHAIRSDAWNPVCSIGFVLLLRGRHQEESEHLKHVMLIGAGSAGQMIFRDIKHAKEVKEKVCCFIDDNPNKWGRYIDGVPVEGGRDEIMRACEKYHIDKIYVVIPSASAEAKKDILKFVQPYWL